MDTKVGCTVVLSIRSVVGNLYATLLIQKSTLTFLLHLFPINISKVTHPSQSNH